MFMKLKYMQPIPGIDQ